MPTSNQSNAAMRSFMDSQASFMTDMSRKNYESVRKLSEINLQLTQQLLEDSVNAARQILGCTNPLQLSGAAVSQLQPMLRHLSNYQQQLMGVLAGVQLDLTRGAESVMPQAGRSASAMAQDIARRSHAEPAYARSGQGNGAAGSNGIHHTPGSA